MVIPRLDIFPWDKFLFQFGQTTYGNDDALRIEVDIANGNRFPGLIFTDALFDFGFKVEIPDVIQKLLIQFVFFLFLSAKIGVKMDFEHGMVIAADIKLVLTPENKVIPIPSNPKAKVFDVGSFKRRVGIGCQIFILKTNKIGVHMQLPVVVV